MRLADFITQKSRDRHGVFALFREFGDAVANAVHFEISADVGRVAHAVSRSDAKKLITAQQFCRVPFQSVWIEWVGTSAKFGEEPAADDDRPGIPEPERCGVLIDALSDDMAMGLVSFAWGHKNLGPNVCPLSFVFDWSGKDRVTKRHTVPMTNAEVRERFPKFKHSSDDDLDTLERRGEVVENPYLKRLIDEVQKAGPVAMTRLRENAFYDSQGEPGFAESLLSVMNSRNLVSVSDAEDMTKINKARRKVGRPALLSFRSVRLSLSRGVSRRLGESEGGAIPLHTVRGHFKIRKSGIYWWSPFWRGDASVGVVSRAGYRVVA